MEWGTVAQLLTALGLGAVVTNALRSRASKSGEMADTLGKWEARFKAQDERMDEQEREIAQLKLEVADLKLLKRAVQLQPQDIRRGIFAAYDALKREGHEDD